MIEGTENPKAAGGITKAPKVKMRESTIFKLAIGSVIILAVSAVVYFLARGVQRDEPRTVEMPRVSLSLEQERSVWTSIESRLRGFVMTDDEKRLSELLAVLSEAEVENTGDERDADAGARAESGMREFHELAGRYYTAEPGRFALLGMSLAMSFNEALLQVLEKARRGDLDSILQTDSTARKVEELGGNFVTEALKTGIIDGEGQLNASPILPQVLFRRRWFALAGRGGKENFSEAEQLVNYDFIVNFSSAANANSRLIAIDKLVRLRPDYNADVARAIVFFEAKDLKGALKAIEERARNSPKGSALRGFYDNLERRIREDNAM